MTNTIENKERKSLIKALKANTIFHNHYNNVYVPQSRTNLFVGKVSALKNSDLKNALNKGGFIA